MTREHALWIGQQLALQIRVAIRRIQRERMALANVRAKEIMGLK